MTAGRPFARFRASRRWSTVSTRGWRISSNSWSGNCASSACTSRVAVSPVESETTWSSTGVFVTPRRLAGNLREVPERAERVADVEEEPEPVRAYGVVLVHDQDLVEEPLHHGRERRAGLERGLDVAVALDRDLRERLGQGFLRFLDEQSAIELRRGLLLRLAGEPVRPVVRRVHAVEGRRFALAVELFGAPGDRGEVWRVRRARRPNVLDGHIEHRFEAFLDEVANIIRQERAVDRQAAFEGKPDEPDRGAAKPVRVTRTRRPVTELERGPQRVQLVRRSEHLAGLRLRERPAGRIGQVL